MGLPAPQALWEVRRPAPTWEPLPSPEGQRPRSPQSSSSHSHMAVGRSGGRGTSGTLESGPMAGGNFFQPETQSGISPGALRASQAPFRPALCLGSPYPPILCTTPPSFPRTAQASLVSRHSTTGLREHRHGAQLAPQAAQALHPGPSYPHPTSTTSRPALPPALLPLGLNKGPWSPL